MTQMSPVATELMSTFESILGEKNVSSALAVREQHGRDESYHKCHPADLVVFPASTEEVSEVAKVCYDNEIPMVPYGTGTGLEGGIVALKVHIKIKNILASVIELTLVIIITND